MDSSPLRLSLISAQIKTPKGFGYSKYLKDFSFFCITADFLKPISTGKRVIKRQTKDALGMGLIHNRNSQNFMTKLGKME